MNSLLKKLVFVVSTASASGDNSFADIPLKEADRVFDSKATLKFHFDKTKSYKEMIKEHIYENTL